MLYLFIRKVWLSLNVIVSLFFLNSAYCADTPTDSPANPNLSHKLRKLRPQSALLPKASHFAPAADEGMGASSLSTPSSYRTLKLGDGLSKVDVPEESRLYFHPLVLGIAFKRSTLERTGVDLSYINAKIHDFVQKILQGEEQAIKKLLSNKQPDTPSQPFSLLPAFFSSLDLNTQEIFIKDANDSEDVSLSQSKNYLSTKLSPLSEMTLMALRIQIAGLYRGDFGYPKNERQAQIIYALYKEEFEKDHS